MYVCITYIYMIHPSDRWMLKKNFSSLTFCFAFFFLSLSLSLSLSYTRWRPRRVLKVTVHTHTLTHSHTHRLATEQPPAWSWYSLTYDAIFLSLELGVDHGGVPTLRWILYKYIYGKVTPPLSIHPDRQPSGRAGRQAGKGRGPTIEREGCVIE